jgi:hypothetical protein
VNRSGDRTATSSTCTAVDELQSGEENLRLLGQRSRLPGAGARRRAGERLERLDPADAAAGGSWPGPTESLAPRTHLEVLWCQPKLSVCGQRGMQTTAT